LDAEYLELSDTKKVAALLDKDREPTSLSGKWLIVIDSAQEGFLMP